MNPKKAESPAVTPGGERSPREIDFKAGLEVSVVIPVFRAESVLPELVSRLEAVLNEHTSAFEVILVNDASPDESGAVISRLSESRPWLRGINLMKNSGQHAAVLCGIRAARYSVTVTMDDDLQHPPEEIPKLLREMGKGFDVVYGTPERERHGFLRDVASRLTKLALQSAMGAETARQASALRAFRTEVRHAFDDFRGPHVSIDALLTWGTTRFGAIPVRHDKRRVGTSNYTFGRLVTHALNMMTGFSTLPLQFASLTGFAFTLFGFAALAWVVGRYMIQGSAVAGFPFLASMIAIFSGAQLFALGIIGEYLARVHFRLMDRPAYTVREDSPQATGPSEGG